MRRLIDADALIEVLKAEKKQDRSRAYGEHECDLIAGTIAMCIDTVKTIPTAYDVEKVVVEIADLNNFNIQIADLMLDMQQHNYARRHYINLEDAIDIVRKGGVEC